jgi:hypothetical protein
MTEEPVHHRLSNIFPADAVGSSLLAIFVADDDAQLITGGE